MNKLKPGDIGYVKAVTHRIKEIKQPQGGYLAPKLFAPTSHGDPVPHPVAKEKIAPGFMGTTVDNMSRFLFSGGDFNDAFRIATMGYIIEESRGHTENAANYETAKKEIKKAYAKNNFKEIAFNSIALSMFDVVVRAGLSIDPFRIIEIAEQEDRGELDETLENLVAMAKNGVTFMNKVKATSFGETFEGGYSKTVNKGDCDFTSKDTLWDFKTSKYEFNKYSSNSKNTLQLVMYFLMGKKSGKECFKNLTHIGVFNPRLNKSYRFDMRTLDSAIVKAVCNEVIVFDDK